MKVVLLPQASEDLDEIFDPIFSDIVQRLKTLRNYPMMGVSMTGPFAGYRGTVVDFFRIIYRIQKNNTIEVAYIRDCRRRPL